MHLEQLHSVFKIPKLLLFIENLRTQKILSFIQSQNVQNNYDEKRVPIVAGRSGVFGSLHRGLFRRTLGRIQEEVWTNQSETKIEDGRSTHHFPGSNIYS